MTVLRYPSSRNPLKLARICNSVREQIDHSQPDLVHAHSTYAGLYAHFAAIGRPVVYCAHGWCFDQEIPSWKRHLFAKIEKWLSRRRAAIYHISHYEQKIAHRRGISAPVDLVIYNGVRQSKESGRTAIQVDPTKVNLCFLGRFDRQKGADVLDREFIRVTRKDVHLYVIGGYDRERANTKDEILKDDARITRLGWIENDRIDDYLNQFDAVVVPSRWEGFGLVVTEAMRNGVPALVSNRGGLPEQIIHGYNGFTFELDSPNALAERIESLNKTKLHEMRANCRSVFEHCFAEAHCTNRVTQLYKSLLPSQIKQPPATVPLADYSPKNRVFTKVR